MLLKDERTPMDENQNNKPPRRWIPAVFVGALLVCTVAGFAAGWFSKPDTRVPDVPAPAPTEQTGQPVQPPSQPASAPDAASSYIGVDAAKEAALLHAGVNAVDASRIKCELDLEHGVAIYEVEFDVGRTEYEYEIDACEGTILRADVDYDH